jgi:parvulin-like peptidyl-prolyl isomerase
MEPQKTPFLKVNEDSISLGDAIDYLKAAGGYHRMMTDIMRQYLLQKELEQRPDIKFSNFQVDQAVMDFRVANNLVEPKLFQEWMQVNGVNYDEFRKNIAFGFKVEQLKNELTEPKLEEYFQEQKPLLDRVILSRLIVKDQELAENLKVKILDDRTQFESLVRAYSIVDDRAANGMMGAVPKGKMPNIMKTAIDLANPGEIVGPLEIDGRYCLFRVEKFLPASLEEKPIQHELKNQLFDRWIQEKLKSLNIQWEFE